MNVFDKYSIEEISKKTKISPISLRFIKNKEYEKIPRVKFIGFIKIIEREFNTNLDELIKEYDETVNINTPKETKIEKTNIKESNKSNNFLFILATFLLILAGILLYKNSKKSNSPIQNISINETIQKSTFKNEDNKSKSNGIKAETNLTTSNEKNFKITTPQQNLTDINKSTQSEKNLTINSVTIIPKKLLWYKIQNLDTNETKEFLTSNPKTFKGKNFYIKLGHGEEIIKYSDKNITPNTKKIVKILLKDGNVTYIKGKK